MMPETLSETLRRIREVDAMFDRATGWGSWMVGAANDRERLVNYANHRWQAALEHKNLARTADGMSTD